MARRTDPIQRTFPAGAARWLRRLGAAAVASACTASLAATLTRGC